MVLSAQPLADTINRLPADQDPLVGQALLYYKILHCALASGQEIPFVPPHNTPEALNFRRAPCRM